MNRIKYIHPITGETTSLKVCQPSRDTIMGTKKAWGRAHESLLMDQADQMAHRAGFIRAGLRWRGAAARAALKARALKNALVDNVALGT